MTRIVLQGILFDEKSSFERGARLAPPLIRRFYHSPATNYFAENGVDTNSARVLDRGDFAIRDYFEIERITAENLEKGAKLITLGGDHSITYPVVRAFRRAHPKFDILHFDAHPDLYDELGGDRFSHASPFARLMEEELAERLVQVGIRTLNNHQKEQAEKFGVRIYQMKDLGIAAAEIPDFANPVYLSLDMDAFDPAFAPGVAHPEPGGLTVRQVIDIIRDVRADIIGADIVEYNPKRDVRDLTGVLAAKMLKEILGRMLEETALTSRSRVGIKP